MSYEIIKTHTFGETRYESSVGSENTKAFPGGRYWYETIIKQRRNYTTGTSDFIAEVWIHLEPDNIVNGISYEIYDNYSEIKFLDYICRKGSEQLKGYGSNGKISALLVTLDTLGGTHTSNNNMISNVTGYHTMDGAFCGFYYTSNSSNLTRYNNGDLSISLLGTTKIYGVYINEVGQEEDRVTINWDGFTRDSIAVTPLHINKGVTATAASDFTDETNATLSYAIYTMGHAILIENSTKGWGVVSSSGEKIPSIQVALSLDGVTPDLIDYRDAPLTNTDYTFNFSDEDRIKIQTLVQGSSVVPVYYLIKTVREVYKTSGDTTPADMAEYVTATKRTLTIVGCNPSMNPVVKDIKEETLALTGDENTFIRYESMAEFAINATASKNATIVSQSVQCGSKTITDLPYGVIQDVEDGVFNFYVVDSRAMAAATAVYKNLIEYVKPTCYQKAEVELSAETGASINLVISGSYFNGSFGAVNNTLLLEVRYTDDEGVMGDWITITGEPTFRNNTYELKAVFTGFDYGKSYIFQARATDKLNLAQSSQYTVRLMPVFDWGEKDFNFNVPVNIEADSLDFHNETVLRHNQEANNTVLSASGGHIYFRPGGTNYTLNESVIYPDGSIGFGGAAEFSETATFTDGIVTSALNINGNSVNDYIIETGKTMMGTNGYWHWQKWASGKAECWGCRNFGSMAITTNWGGLYRSEILTQELPDNLFNTTPDSININIVHSSFGGWICKHEQTAPSAITTGSFIFVRPASATASPTNIGFYVVGTWK